MKLCQRGQVVFDMFKKSHTKIKYGAMYLKSRKKYIGHEVIRVGRAE